MQSKLNPYIGFNGQAKEAIEFYKNVFGGKLSVSTFGESGMNQEPNDANKIMHGSLEADNGMTLMVSDTASHSTYESGARISISLSGDNEEELKGYWDKLSEGGKIEVPLEKAPWGDMFGMLDDKFGVKWLVNIAGKK